MKKILKHGLVGLVGIQLLFCMPNCTALAGVSIATDSNAAAETELTYVRELEKLAEEYSSIADEREQFTDTRKEVMIYIRSKQYQSSAWNICAGKENIGFTKYVSEKNKDLKKLRTTGLFNTPYTNEKSKFVHFIGAMNMAYNGYGELGSWAGDLVQMTKNLKDKNPTGDGIETTAKELLCGKSQFTKEEMLADIDSVNIACRLMNEDIFVSQAIDEYYQELMDIGSEERYRLFIKNQFGLDVISKDKLKTETSKIMKNDIFLDILFDNYGISLEDPEDVLYVDAAVSSFTDYIIEHCPDDMIVESSFFPPETEENTQKPDSGSYNQDKTGSSVGSGSGSIHNHSAMSDSNIRPGKPVTMTGEWVKDEHGWYFIYVTGNFPKGSWQYLSYNGKNNWYYFDNEGYMVTGWLQINEIWYYLNLSGEMLTGWQEIDGSWYYLNQSGEMLKNTVTPDGYKLDTIGQWIN